MINRRGLLTGLVGVLAAPAIVRASIIMPVRSLQQKGPDPAFSLLTIDQMREFLRSNMVPPMSDGTYHMILSEEYRRDLFGGAISHA